MGKKAKHQQNTRNNDQTNQKAQNTKRTNRPDTVVNFSGVSFGNSPQHPNPSWTLGARMMNPEPVGYGLRRVSSLRSFPEGFQCVSRHSLGLDRGSAGLSGVQQLPRGRRTRIPEEGAMFRWAEVGSFHTAPTRPPLKRLSLKL